MVVTNIESPYRLLLLNHTVYNHLSSPKNSRYHSDQLVSSAIHVHTCSIMWGTPRDQTLLKVKDQSEAHAKSPIFKYY